MQGPVSCRHGAYRMQRTLLRSHGTTIASATAAVLPRRSFVRAYGSGNGSSSSSQSNAVHGDSITRRGALLVSVALLAGNWSSSIGASKALADAFDEQLASQLPGEAPAAPELPKGEWGHLPSMGLR